MRLVASSFICWGRHTSSNTKQGSRSQVQYNHMSRYNTAVACKHQLMMLNSSMGLARHLESTMCLIIMTKLRGNEPLAGLSGVSPLGGVENRPRRQFQQHLPNYYIRYGRRGHSRTCAGVSTALRSPAPPPTHPAPIRRGEGHEMDVDAPIPDTRRWSNAYGTY